VKRLAAAMLILLSALAGAAWWAGGSEEAVRGVAGRTALAPASSPRRPPIDLVLEYDPPARPLIPPSPVRSGLGGGSAPRLSPPRPDPPSAAVAEYLPPGTGLPPSPGVAPERPAALPRALPAALPAAPSLPRLAASAAPLDTSALEEAELPPDLSPDLPPERAALLRRLLAIRERVGAGD
jgi:hypothetical protein